MLLFFRDTHQFQSFKTTLHLSGALRPSSAKEAPASAVCVKRALRAPSLRCGPQGDVAASAVADGLSMNAAITRPENDGE
jgi:hypothetical protein